MKQDCRMSYPIFYWLVFASLGGRAFVEAISSMDRASSEFETEKRPNVRGTKWRQSGTEFLLLDRGGENEGPGGPSRTHNLKSRFLLSFEDLKNVFKTPPAKVESAPVSNGRTKTPAYRPFKRIFSDGQVKRGSYPGFKPIFPDDYKPLPPNAWADKFKPIFDITEGTPAPIRQPTAAPAIASQPTSIPTLFPTSRPLTIAPTSAPVTQPTTAPTRGSTPDPTSSPISMTPPPTSAPVGGTPQPTSAPVGGTPQPTSAPVGGTPQPTSAPIGGTPQPTSAPVGGTPAPTSSPGGTPSPTSSPGGTPSPTSSPGGTPSPTSSPGGTPSPTSSPGGTPSPTAADMGTPSPTASNITETPAPTPLSSMNVMEPTTGAPTNNATNATVAPSTSPPDNNATMAPGSNATEAPGEGNTTAAPSGTTPGTIEPTASPAGENATMAPGSNMTESGGENATTVPTLTPVGGNATTAPTLSPITGGTMTPTLVGDNGTSTPGESNATEAPESGNATMTPTTAPLNGGNITDPTPTIMTPVENTTIVPESNATTAPTAVPVTVNATLAPSFVSVDGNGTTAPTLAPSAEGDATRSGFLPRVSPFLFIQEDTIAQWENKAGPSYRESATNAGAFDFEQMDWREKIQFSGSVDEKFGSSIDMNAESTVFVVGAPLSHRGGQGSGEVRIYFPYQEGRKSFSFIGCTGDELGRSVAISKEGNVVAAGAIGYVNVYARDAKGIWYLRHTISDSGSPNLGESLALSSNGATLVVGSSKEREVRVYGRTSDEWVLRGQALNSDFDDGFGSSVAVNNDGSIVAVGSPQGGPQGEGSVSLFRPASGPLLLDLFRKRSWQSYGSVIFGLGAGDGFGTAIALSRDGHRVAVGAHQSATSEFDYVAVFDFNGNTRTWKHAGQVLRGSKNRSLLGASVSLSADGGSMSVGAIGSRNMGMALVWRFQDSQWKLIGSEVRQKTNGKCLDAFTALSGDGMTLLVGAPLESATDSPDMGHVRLYDLSPAQ